MENIKTEINSWSLKKLKVFTMKIWNEKPEKRKMGMNSCGRQKQRTICVKYQIQSINDRMNMYKYETKCNFC